MKKGTIECILAVAQGDDTATESEIAGLRYVLSALGKKADQEVQQKEIYTRAEVAKRFGRTPAWVDQEARRPGTMLRRFYGTGRKRAIGFSRASVEDALAQARCVEGGAL